MCPKTKRPTTIRLASLDAVFIFRADGQQEMFLPEGDDDDEMPNHVFEATMLAFVMSDPETYHLVRDLWQKRVDNEAETTTH